MIRLHPLQDLQTSGLVARTFALHDVVLSDLVATRAMPFDEALGEALSNSRVAFDDTGCAALSEDGSILNVRVAFTVTARQDGGEGPEILSVSGAFDVRYERRVDGQEIEEAALQTFAKINGVYNAWPYLREVVSSTFGRLGYPPYTLPSLVISPEREESEQSTPPLPFSERSESPGKSSKKGSAAVRRSAKKSGKRAKRSRR